MFSCEYSEMFKNNYSEKNLWTIASEHLLLTRDVFRNLPIIYDGPFSWKYWTAIFVEKLRQLIEILNTSCLLTALLNCWTNLILYGFNLQ